MVVPVDVITEDRDLSSYKFVVAPAYQLLDRNLVKKWTAYAENGGNLVLSARTGQKDRDGHLWEAMWAEPIHSLIGATIPRYDLLPGSLEGRVVAGEGRYNWGSWAEILEPMAGTTVIARYADQFYVDKAAAVTRKLGKGTVTYIGVDSVKGDLEASLLRRVYTTAGASPQNLPPDFVIDWRDGFWVATNFTSQARAIPAAASAEVLVGARTVPPGGVAVWKE
jgi:beta-galactosidase